MATDRSNRRDSDVYTDSELLAMEMYDDEDTEPVCGKEFAYRGGQGEEDTIVLKCERTVHSGGLHENYTFKAPLTLKGHTLGGLYEDLKRAERDLT